MYKLGQPISPLEVMRNGSYAQHAVGDEGVSVDSTDGTRRLFIRWGQGRLTAMANAIAHSAQTCMFGRLAIMRPALRPWQPNRTMWLHAAHPTYTSPHPTPPHPTPPHPTPPHPTPPHPTPSHLTPPTPQVV